MKQKNIFTYLLGLVVLLGGLLNVAALAQSSSSTTYRVRSAASLPSTCNPGPATTDVFIRTGATSPGVYFCSAANTWSGPLASSSGGGTVLDVAVTTANGVSGSVANAATHPDITLTLGNITPTTVNGLTISTSSGTLTITNSKTFSVSNTLTITAADGSTLNVGAGGTLGTAAYTATGAYEVPLTFNAGVTRATNAVSLDVNNANTWTANQTFGSGILRATSPQVTTGINDSNGNAEILFTATGSAVNQFTIANAASGGAPVLSTAGSGTDINITLTPKGAGQVIIPSGTAALPGIGLSGCTTCGFSFTNSMPTLSVSGTGRYAWNGFGAILGSAMQLLWDTTSGAGGGSASTGLARPSAGIVRVTNGSTGIGGFLVGSSTDTGTVGSLVVASTVTTGTGTTAGIQGLFNSLTTGNGADFSTSSGTTGNVVSIASTSTAAASNTLNGLKIAMSGANAAIAQTVTGGTISVTNTNATSGTNVGLQSTASGATTQNLAGVFVGDVAYGGTTSSFPVITNRSGAAQLETKVAGGGTVARALIWGGGYVSSSASVGTYTGAIYIDPTTGVRVGSTSIFGFNATADAVSGAADLQMRRLTTASLVLGLANNATPVANILTIGESSRGGTDTNVAGANGTIQAGLGTGTGGGGSLLFRTAAAGSTGTTANTYTTALTIDNSQHLITGAAAAPTVGGSCGTSPSIAGTDMGGRVTTGSVAPTSCTVTFNKAFTNIPACTAGNETTSNLLRATPTTTTLTLAGTMVAGDILSYTCVAF